VRGLRLRPAWRRRLLQALAGIALAGLTATLAGALQARKITVVGTHRFPGNQVEAVLRGALGTPTVAVRPQALREKVREVPWVADAQVTVSLDGIVHCLVRERTPVAVEVDGNRRQLLDAAGRQLGVGTGAEPTLVLSGFSAFPAERATVLAAVSALERAWKAPLARVERLGPGDVVLHFAEETTCVVADPTVPESLVEGRAVLAAWERQTGAAPLRLDVRVPGRVALLPAPAPPPPPEEGS
jgi:cell division septal protein FtsQ